jgi:hypothetical protein
MTATIEKKPASNDEAPSVGVPSGVWFGDSEPEDCIAQALYLLQLCQQDLNMGRKSTIWARAKRAREACQALEATFSPNTTAHPRHE